MKLSGKKAIITGAAQGIGLAIAKRFMQEGASLVIADIDDEAGAKAVDALKKLGSVHYVHADIGERLDVHNLVASAIDLLGGIDILVNNAGIALGGDFFAIKPEEFDKVLRVNLTGAFLCSQAVAKHMVERLEAKEEGADARGFSIINMSSINAILAIPSQIPYTISKGGVRQLTNVLAQVLAPHDIRVNAIGPGSIDTAMLASVNASPEAMRKVMMRTPMGRLGETDEIAAIAVFLASQDASYITGQTIYADGGRLGLAYTVDVPE